MDTSVEQTQLEAQIEALRVQLQSLTDKLSVVKATQPSTEVVKSPTTLTIKDRTGLYKLFGKDQGVSYIGKTVAIASWIRTVRKQGGGTFAFIELNDGTIMTGLQCIAKETIPGYTDVLAKIGTGASVLVIGEIIASPGTGQKIELVADTIEVLGSVPNDYPLAKKEHSLEFLREKVLHLRPRTKTISAMSRIRSALAFATHKFYQERGFVYCHTPLLTASDCEGAGEMFQVTTLLSKANDDITKIEKTPEGKVNYGLDFFKKPAFLCVSGQLNGEAYASALSNIYTFGPTFRAEMSNTTRHLAEFWMIEPEIAFADLTENMDVAEAYIKFCIQYVLDNFPLDVQFFEMFEKEQIKKADAEEVKRRMAEKKEAKNKPKVTEPKPEVKEGEVAEPKDKKKKAKKTAPPPENLWQKKSLRERLQNTLDNPFQRVSYTEAIEILKEAVEKGVEFKTVPEWGIDLPSEHERYIAEVVFQKPVILYNYPKEIKAFYMRLNDDGKTVAAMDILVPGIGEVVGGSQREERADLLKERILDAKLDPNSYKWYLELREFGTVPHAGFGLGFERLVRYLTGLENIRDVIPFPRFPGHCQD